MITFPPDFSKTHVPGYFWSTQENWLYSIKSGILRPLKLYPAYTGLYGHGCPFPHFRISNLGTEKAIPRWRLAARYNGPGRIEGTVAIERK